MEESTAFTVTPMSQQISLDPGQVYQGSIEVVNPSSSSKDFSFKANITPYGVVGEDYQADLLTQSSYTTITDWITIENPTGTIKPNETAKIYFTIKVPGSAPGGGQYATISVSSNNEQESSEGFAIQDVYEMSSIIYANINGETVHEGELLSNEVPGFVLTTPITTTSLFSNSGNVHEVADYTITVTDFFTGRVITPTEENTGHYTEVIMPNTTRSAEREINDLPALGIVKVNQTINYNGQTSTVEKNVFICPLWFIVLVAITIISIVVTIIHSIRRHRHKFDAV